MDSWVLNLLYTPVTVPLVRCHALSAPSLARSSAWQSAIPGRRTAQDRPGIPSRGAVPRWRRCPARVRPPGCPPARRRGARATRSGDRGRATSGAPRPGGSAVPPGPPACRGEGGPAAVGGPSHERTGVTRATGQTRRVAARRPAQARSNEDERRHVCLSAVRPSG